MQTPGTALGAQAASCLSVCLASWLGPFVQPAGQLVDGASVWICSARGRGSHRAGAPRRPMKGKVKGSEAAGDPGLGMGVRMQTRRRGSHTVCIAGCLLSAAAGLGWFPDRVEVVAAPRPLAEVPAFSLGPSRAPGLGLESPAAGGLDRGLGVLGWRLATSCVSGRLLLGLSSGAEWAGSSCSFPAPTPAGHGTLL